jgi:hypothetical protein
VCLLCVALFVQQNLLCVEHDACDADSELTLESCMCGSGLAMSASAVCPASAGHGLPEHDDDDGLPEGCGSTVWS